MRRLIILSSIILSFLFTSQNLAQWELRSNGLPQEGITYALDASDSLTAVISIYIYSSPNSLYKTTDGGKNWYSLANFTSNKNSAVDVSIQDKDHIWAGLDDGSVYATSDGGTSWNLQWKDFSKSQFIDYIKMFNASDGIAMGDAPPSSDFNASFFTDASTGYAVGYDPVNLLGFIYKTSNGGSNWGEVFRKDSAKLSSVYFTDTQTGIVVGDNGTILRTTDGGTNWTDISKVTQSDFETVYFASPSVGFISGSWAGHFLKTTDGGETWGDIYLQKSANICSIFFIDSNTGWALADSWGSDYGVVIKTTDGGENWDVVNNGDVSVRTNSKIFFINNNRGWVSSGSYFYYTTDSGTTWSAIRDTTIVYPVTIFFFGASNGIAAGQYGFEKTTDGGITWNVVPNTSTYWIKGLSFINTSTGYAAGAKNLVLKTTDGGNTWVEQHYTAPGPALFIRTTDGGKTWNQTNTSYLAGTVSGDIWRRLDFADNNAGFFYTSGVYPQQLYKTGDGGKTWSAISFEVIPQVMKFYNSNIGLIFNSGSTTNSTPSKIYRTIDGGDTWQTFEPENIEAAGWGNSIAFLHNDPSKVWLTDGTNLYFSSDTGRTWIGSTPGLMNGGGRDIVFTEDNYGWFACDGGIVYRTANGYKSVTDVKGGNDIIAKTFQLEQNYPNPFNPSTTISYQLPNNSFVTLKIYDELGREVKTLVNQFQHQGSYKINFDASQFSSGIFIYRLQTDNYSASRKMIFLK